MNIETDSSISSVNKGALYITSNGLITVTGAGKLSISTTDGICVQLCGKSNDLKASTTIIKDANMDLLVTGSSTNRPAISFSGGDLTIDNSKVNIASEGKTLGIWGYAKYTLNADGSLKQITPTWKAGEGDTGSRNLIIQNGSVVTGVATAKQFMGAKGEVIIRDSTVEASITNNSSIFDKKPILEGEYTAVAGSKPEKVVVYNPNKMDSYRYIKIVPGKVDLIPTEATTEPTTAPTEPTTVPTEPVTVPTTEPVTTPTELDATQAPTQPVATQAPTVDSGNNQTTEEAISAGLIVTLIVIGSVSVLVGISLALLWFVIKPKWLVKK